MAYTVVHVSPILAVRVGVRSIALHGSEGCEANPMSIRLLSFTTMERDNSPNNQQGLKKNV